MKSLIFMICFIMVTSIASSNSLSDRKYALVSAYAQLLSDKERITGQILDVEIRLKEFGVIRSIVQKEYTTMPVKEGDYTDDPQG